MRYVVSLLVIAFAVSLVIKTEFYYGLTGAMDWPETHIGPGGTRVFLKIIGLILIFGALFYMTGSLEGLGRAVFTPTVPVQ